MFITDAYALIRAIAIIWKQMESINGKELKGANVVRTKVKNTVFALSISWSVLEIFAIEVQCYSGKARKLASVFELTHSALTEAL